MKKLILVSFMMFSAIQAHADCWGNVSFLIKKNNGNVDFGINPKDANSCNCVAVAAGAIGTGSRTMSMSASNGNIKEAYSALLAAITTNTKIYVFSSTCTATEIMSYAQ